MRRIQGAIVWTLTVFALAVPASAQRSNTSRERSNEGGGGGSSEGGGTGGGGSASDTDTRTENRDLINHNGDELPDEDQRSWSIEGGIETHALLWRSNLEGAAENKLFNYYFVDGHVDVGRYNRFSIFEGVYERFIADSSEMGVRLDDASLAYTRLMPLSSEFLLQARLSLGLPTSYEASLEGLYVEPTVSLRLGGSFFHHLLNLDARVFGSYFVVKYNTEVGGNPNAQARLGMQFDAELTMPFHHPLSIGAEIYVAYYWYYTPYAASSPNMMEPIATTDPTYGTTQPIQEVYGGEVFLRYALPTLAGLHIDLRAALAMGDTTLGYTSLIHDGVGYLYLDYWQNYEAYGALTIRY